MIRSFSTLLLALLLCTPLAAQVNYKLLPDYDNVPPVDWRLGVKNGNAPIIIAVCVCVQPIAQRYEKYSIG